MLGFGALGELALGGFPSEQQAISASVGVFTITGQDAGLYATRYLTAECGVFTLTFNDIDFSRTSNRLRVVSGGGIRGLRASSGGGGKGLRIRA